MNISKTRVFTVLLLGVFAGGAYFWWQQRAAEQGLAANPAPAATQAIAPSSTPELSVAPASATPPPIAHPISAADTSQPSTVAALPALADADSYVAQALAALLGQPSVQTFLLSDGFVRHVVATVDNLPQGHASWTVWPVNRTAGRFTTLRVESDSSQAEVISADNAARYAPFVKFVASVDSGRAVALYVQLYPLFQQAYEELGYPGRYFNDRLVAVIDHLLATPPAPAQIPVTLVDVKGSVKSLQPWTRYEFADPALEQLSAGQKILLRVGPANQQQLKAKLREFRARIVARGAVPQP